MTNDIFSKLRTLPDARHLARLAQTAVQLHPEDPNTVLIKLRQFGEATLQYLAARWQIDTAQLEKQHDLLMLLQYKLILPPDIIDRLHALRKKGNQAVHEWHEDVADAHINLQHARHIADWLWHTFALPENPAPAPNDATPTKRKPPKRKTKTSSPPATTPQNPEHAQQRAQAKAERQAQRQAEKQSRQAQRDAQTQQHRDKKARRAERLQHVKNLFEQGLAHELCHEYPDAFRHYLEAAQRGYYPAMTKLGLFYASGRGTPTDPKAASYWNHLAAQNGDPIACNNLANLYAVGEGVAQNTPRALELYHRAARKNYAPAQYNLGNIYRKGKIVPRNLTLAAAWYKKAAAQHLSFAHYWLGVFYEHGHGIRQNPAKAEQHYRQAAEQNHLEAQLALADFYLKGEHTEKNHPEAVRWLEKAAAQNHPRAQHNLAIILGCGLGGIPPDPAHADHWLQKSAAQGYPASLVLIQQHPSLRYLRNDKNTLH